ncbi:MAG: NADH-quinone oxidoreductase subunit NuoH [Armatimonadota bacterium]
MPFEVAAIAALIKIVVALGFIMLAVPMLVWLERKLIADFQARVGPSRVGPFGLLQSFVDGIKLLTKEALQPAQVDRLLYYLGPVMVMIPALVVGAVVPFAAPLQVGDYVHRMVIADLPIGILFILALTSISVYGIVLSGWSSNSKYSLLGALRSAAQMVSYELPLGLSLIAGLMIASWADPQGLFGLSLVRVVEAQDGGILNWVAFNYRFGFLGLIALVMFYICGLAETNRAPFDLPEAETELVAGYLTEYGGMKWAMFFLGEYAAMLNVAAVATTVFLGGWHSPYPESWLPIAVNSLPYMLHGLLWFGLKIFLIIVIYMWIRATLPRMRYDHLMSFAWKGLLPGSLVMIFVVATILTAAHAEPPPAVLLGPGAQNDQRQLPAPPIETPGGEPGAPAGNAPAANAPAANTPGAAAPVGNAPAEAPANANNPAAPAGNAPAPGGQ